MVWAQSQQVAKACIAPSLLRPSHGSICGHRSSRQVYVQMRLLPPTVSGNGPPGTRKPCGFAVDGSGGAGIGCRLTAAHTVPVLHTSCLIRPEAEFLESCLSSRLVQVAFTEELWSCCINQLLQVALPS